MAQDECILHTHDGNIQRWFQEGEVGELSSKDGGRPLMISSFMTTEGVLGAKLTNISIAGVPDEEKRVSQEPN